MIDTFPREQFAARFVAGRRNLAAALAHGSDFFAEIRDKPAHDSAIGGEFLGMYVDIGLQRIHLGQFYLVSAMNSRLISMRRISDMRAPIS
jgi:hypothetical protein